MGSFIALVNSLELFYPIYCFVFHLVVMLVVWLCNLVVFSLFDLLLNVVGGCIGTVSWIKDLWRLNLHAGRFG